LAAANVPPPRRPKIDAAGDGKGAAAAKARGGLLA
jgi:hypothetical protein